MQPFQIFNPEVKNKATKIFGGQASGLCDWDDVKYPVMLQINEGMFSNLWSLAKVSLKSDRIDYQENLTKREKETFNQIVYSLRELNEVMDRFNFYIGFLSSDPSIQQNAQLISTFKGLHDNVYRLFQNHFSIDGQNNHSSYRFAAQPLEEFIQLSGQRILKAEAEWSKEELQGLLQGLIHYALISGIVFQGAFVYFQALAAKGKMIGVNNTIKLIRVDETRHLQFYGELIKIFLNENSHVFTSGQYEQLIETIKEAVKREKIITADLFSELGVLSGREYEGYIEYLANQVCKYIGVREIYADNQTLKLKWMNVNDEISKSGPSQTLSSVEEDDDFDW